MATANTENLVTASEDIYSQKGTLLVKKGLSLQPDVARIILNHKLVKPLELTVSMEGCVDGRQLYQDVMEPLLRSEDLKTIHQLVELKHTLIRNCRLFSKYPLLTHKVTILKRRLPEEYEKAVFCAWFCLAIAHQLELDEPEQQAAFLAGLCHDIGMLHLDPAILNNTGEYQAEEWQAMQNHTLIADAFLSYIPNLPPLTRQAVREHHERSDGSGYPNGLFKDQLSLVGQIVAMSDSLCAIRRRDKDNGGLLQLPDMIPILQVNSTQYPRTVYSATIAVIKMSPSAGLPRLPDASTLVGARQLQEHRQALEHCFHAAFNLYEELKDESIPRFKTARIMTRHLYQIITSSGLLGEPIKRWLEYLETQAPESAQREIFEMQLMYRELTWNMRQLYRVLQLASSDAALTHPQVVVSLKSVLEQTDILLENHTRLSA